MDEIEFIFGTILFVVVVLTVGINIYESNAPCSEFSNVTIRNIPARCLYYYDKNK